MILIFPANDKHANFSAETTGSSFDVQVGFCFFNLFRILFLVAFHDYFNNYDYLYINLFMDLYGIIFLINKSTTWRWLIDRDKSCKS